MQNVKGGSSECLLSYFYFTLKKAAKSLAAPCNCCMASNIITMLI